MTYWRNPEIEAMLGGPMDETGLTESSIKNLITLGARENEILEFKKEYPKTVGRIKNRWTNEQEFAKDAAGFANGRGGMILVGLGEEDGVAGALTPLSETTAEREVQRMRTALLRHLAPYVEVRFVVVPCAMNGFLLGIIIPPSRRGPHAVLGDPGNMRRPLMLPVRDVTDTDWLNEHDVSERYRRRFLAQSDHDRRMTDVLDDGHNSLGESDALWMYMAVVPEGLAEPDSITAWLGRRLSGSTKT